MKKYILIFIISVVYIQILFAQKEDLKNFSDIDKVILNIPDSETKTAKGIGNYIVTNWKHKEDQIRAVYSWITSNIEYDIENMFEINIQEKKEDKLSKVLKTRKGICEHYALLFYNICKEIGIKSYIIDGYAKQNGVVNNTPHSWSAAYINDEWYLFDPTWGAGGEYNGKFIKKRNDSYYKVKPAQFINSHMPFDYLWQFLEYPVTSQEFYDGSKSKSTQNAYFNYVDSIAVWDGQSDIDRMMSSASRVEKNGIKNSITAEYLRNLKISIENERQSSIIDQFNLAINDFNQGVYGLNDFISYRNNRFTPKKEDAEISLMLNAPMEKLYTAKNRLSELEKVNNQQNIPIGETIRSINEAIKVAKENQEWLNSYLKKGKLARKGMFQKVTWFGIPLN